MIEYLSYEKAVFTFTGPPNIQLLKFWLFNFSNFQTTFAKNFMKKLPGFKIDFQSSDKVLPLHQHLWSEIFRQWSNSPLKPFWHLHGRAFLLLKFCKRREILKAQFLLILLKYIVVGYSNGNGCLTGGLFSKLRDVEYSVPFFYISHL